MSVWRRVGADIWEAAQTAGVEFVAPWMLSTSTRVTGFRIADGLLAVVKWSASTIARMAFFSLDLLSTIPAFGSANMGHPNCGIETHLTASKPRSAASVGQHAWLRFMRPN